MALSADVATGVLGGRVKNLVTGAVVPVKVVVYTDYEKLADLPGGADESGDLLVGGDKSVPVVTIANSTTVTDTSANLWGYKTDATGKWEITVIGDSDLIGQPKFTYRMVVTSLDGTITYSDTNPNVPAGSKVWLAGLPVKTTASAGSNRTTVNLIGGGGGGSGIWDEIVGKPTVVAAGETQADARAEIGAGTSSVVIGTTAGTAKGAEVQPAWGEVTGKPSTFAPAAHTHTLDQVANVSATGTSLLTAASAAAARTSGLGFTSVGNSVVTATDQPAAATAIGLGTVLARLTALESALTAKAELVVEAGGTYNVVTPAAGQIFVGADNPGVLMDEAKDIWLGTP